MADLIGILIAHIVQLQFEAFLRQRDRAVSDHFLAGLNTAIDAFRPCNIERVAVQRQIEIFSLQLRRIDFPLRLRASTVFGPIAARQRFKPVRHLVICVYFIFLIVEVDDIIRVH